MRPLFTQMKSRHTIQWLYAVVTLAVLLLGWKFPILGFVVAFAITGGIVSGLLYGRWFCGNLCPRGGFLERVVSKISPGKAPAAWLRSKPIRLFFIVLLPVMLTVNVILNPLDWRQWGQAFWMVCLVTTLVGVVLALIYNARAWCAVCPMGTMQNWLDRRKYGLELDSPRCKECRVCEKACPMGLTIIGKTENGPAILPSNDCVCCGECVAKCPTKALRLQ